MTKSRLRTSASCFVSTLCYTVQHYGVHLPGIQVCVPTLTHKTDSSALFVPTYTKLASVCDHVVELKHCQHVVLCGICVVLL